jgi:hypothetical protein
MTSYKDAFIKAAELGKVEAGKFYDDVARDYLKKYGYHTPYDVDLREDQDVASDVDENEDVDTLPPEEGTARSAYFDDVRKVSILTTKGKSLTRRWQKIGAWFRGEYGGVLKTNKKQATTSFKELFDRPEMGPPRPVRPRILNFYSTRFYKTRIKARYDARWAEVSKLPAPPAAISVQNAIIKEAWNAETPQFKAEVEAEWTKEYEAELEAYETVVSGETPKTPEEYQM